MTLFEICREIGTIEEGLICGEINFSYDNMMSAMKPGHPADILDDILSVIGWDVYAGREPSIEKVRETYKGLNEYIACFKVKELKIVLKHLKEYLEINDPDFQKRKERSKKFISEYDKDHYTVIHIPQLTGKKVKLKYQNYYEFVANIQGLPLVKYYFMLWIPVDEAGCFTCAKVRKVGGAASDSARGSEWYEELRAREVSLIGNFIINNCME